MISLSREPLQNFLNINAFTNFYLTFPETRVDIMKNQIKNKEVEFINSEKLVDGSSLSAESHQVLLGSLLGDMHLRKEYKNSNIEESHSIKQRDYLEWKYKILSNFFDLKLYNFNNPICKARGKIYTRKTEVSLRSKVSEKLNLYHDLFYKNKIKKITLPLLNQLDTLALAVWYCDDGYYDSENHTISLHTEGFSMEENKILKEWFYKKWNIKVNFKKDHSKKKVSLRFPVKETNKFLQLINGYIFDMPESIWYKLGHFWEGNASIINKSKLNKIKRNKIYRCKPEVRLKDRQHAKKYYYRNRENILQKKVEYRKTKGYKDYITKYHQGADVRERVKERLKIYRQRPEYKKKASVYQKKYQKRPQVIERRKEYNRRAREKLKGGGQS